MKGSDVDITSFSAPPVSPPSRAGGAGFALKLIAVPSAATTPVPDSTRTDISGFSPSNSDTLAADANRDAPSSDSLEQAIKQVNDSFKQNGQNLYASFEKDKITGIDVVKIVDKKTNETIRQMPPKEMVALAQFLERPQGRGQLIYTTA